MGRKPPIAEQSSTASRDPAFSGIEKRRRRNDQDPRHLLDRSKGKVGRPAAENIVEMMERRGAQENKKSDEQEPDEGKPYAGMHLPCQPEDHRRKKKGTDR